MSSLLSSLEQDAELEQEWEALAAQREASLASAQMQDAHTLLQELRATLIA
ncbi:hypothetical protein V8J88_00120 [Massilia sp. W12]|uniref:hypothetical protein n=1 Tax=Massilia sp. W12 TaxID=3126507 RepID=UPI0030D08915